MPRRTRRPKPQKIRGEKKPSTRSAKHYEQLARDLVERKATQ